MTTTATLDVRDALAEAIRSGGSPPSGPGGPILGTPRFYRGQAPSDAVLGYFLIGGTDESAAGFYMRPGQDGAVRVHCWGLTEDDALRMYGWLTGLVHERALMLATHVLVVGQVRLVQAVPDADRSAWQAAADYRYTTLDA